MTDSPFKQADASGFRQGLTSYGDQGFSLFLRKAFIKGAGYTDAALDKPVIGIANTASAYNPCHGNSAPLIEALERGILLAGGLPMTFPTISLHESFAAPTSMYFAQPHGHGHRGNVACPTHGRGGFDWRVRQNCASAIDGCSVRWLACDSTYHGFYVDRFAPRRAGWRLYRLPPLLGPLPCR
jgi:hypothetical protein